MFANLPQMPFLLALAGLGRSRERVGEAAQQKPGFSIAATIEADPEKSGSV